MDILYVAAKHDYGIPEQGYSFAHFNLYDALLKMGHELLYFDYLTLCQELGRANMNRRLVEIAKAEQPDLLFSVVSLDGLERSAIEEISENTDTVTVAWYTDDHKQFETKSLLWTPVFNWVVTTSEAALPKYRVHGFNNVVKSQWACNPNLYARMDLPVKFPVSFVGRPHGQRRRIIEKVRAAGIDVSVWGTGWESGRLTQEDMIRVFNQSAINLNFSEASQARRYRFKVWHNWFRRRVRQIKARTFEVSGCGGFLLTDPAENLSIYYEVNREIGSFNGTQDLIRKIQYFLDHEDERLTIADLGYARTLKEHTYQHRFREIFETIGV